MFNGLAAEDGVELVRRIRQRATLKVVGDGMNPVFNRAFYKPGRYVHAVDFVNLRQGPKMSPLAQPTSRIILPAAISEKIRLTI